MRTHRTHRLNVDKARRQIARHDTGQEPARPAPVILFSRDDVRTLQANVARAAAPFVEGVRAMARNMAKQQARSVPQDIAVGLAAGIRRMQENHKGTSHQEAIWNMQHNLGRR